MFESGYIEDGYTRKGFIKARENMYQDLRFEYRPVLYVARRKLLELNEKPGQAIVAIKTVANQVQSWNLTKPIRDEATKKVTGKEVVKINEKEVYRVHPDLMEGIFMIVCGQWASETDPEWTDEEKQESEARQLEAALHETDPDFGDEQTNSKNSISG